MSKSPFDFLKTINRTKENLLENPEYTAKDYKPFLMNRALSFRASALPLAAMMNERHWIPPEHQYTFLRLTVPKESGYTPWIKPPAADPNIELVANALGYSKARAAEIIDLFDEADFDEMRLSTYQGGTEPLHR